MDIETAFTELRPSRFRRALVVVVGLTAVTASLLAFLESEAGRAADAASLRATRLAIDIFAGTAGGMPRTSLSVNAQRQALVVSSQGEFRRIVGEDDAARRRGEADVEAGGRLGSQAGGFAAAPAPPQVDEYAARIAGTDPQDLQPVVEEQNAAVDAADAASARGGRAVAGLTIVAMSAALAALAAVLGETRSGRVSLLLSALTLSVALAAAVAALA